MDFNRAGLAAEGFTGFVPVRMLKAVGCGAVPATPGVYLVYRETDDPPVFLRHSIGGRHKARKPTQIIAKLEDKWVKGARVLYFGKTGNPLCDRVAEYIRCGNGLPHSHQGGRYIWQLQDCDDFLIAWKPTPGRKPLDVEDALVTAFHSAYGSLPFANINRPRRKRE